MRLTALCAALMAFSASPSFAQTYQFEILGVEYSAADPYPAVTFRVMVNGAPLDLRNVPANPLLHSPARIGLQVGWDTRDYQNTGSRSDLAPATLPNGAAPPAPAQPIAINGLRNLDATNFFAPGPLFGSFRVKGTVPVPATASGTGVVVMEGRLAQCTALCSDPVASVWAPIAVKSVYKNFLITGSTITARRNVVDVAKCKTCHGVLSTHGNNRTDEIQACVVCHNPNATDAAWRTAKIAGVASNDGPEESTDFKRMVHGIHATVAGMRRSNPLKVMGFQHNLVDFSQTGKTFNTSLANCQACHIAGTYGLPLGKNVLGSTVKTWSRIEAEYTPATATAAGFFTKYNFIDPDPANDLKISPTAAVCSACHTGSEVRNHMVQNGAQFAALQQQMTTSSGAPRERCANCHGVGREKDVVKVHAEEARESSTSTSFSSRSR